MKREIVLVDPAGGEIVEIEDLLYITHTVIGTVGVVEVPCRFVPGELRVTPAALEQLGEEGVIKAFEEHLREQWWNSSREDRKENDRAVRFSGAIYNIDRDRRIMLITYPGDNSTLITSDEY